MTEESDGDFAEYSCHVGHVFALSTLVAEQADALESALWAAIRSFTESDRSRGALPRRRRGTSLRAFSRRQRR